MKVWLLEAEDNECVGMFTGTQRLFCTQEKALEAFKSYLNYPSIIEPFKKGREEWIEEISKTLQREGKVRPASEYGEYNPYNCPVDDTYCDGGVYSEEYTLAETELYCIDDMLYTLKEIEIEE